MAAQTWTCRCSTLNSLGGHSRSRLVPSLASAVRRRLRDGGIQARNAPRSRPQADGDHYEPDCILLAAGRKVRTASRYRQAEVQPSRPSVCCRPVAERGRKSRAARSTRATSNAPNPSCRAAATRSIGRPATKRAWPPVAGKPSRGSKRPDWSDGSDHWSKGPVSQASIGQVTRD